MFLHKKVHSSSSQKYHIPTNNINLEQFISLIASLVDILVPIIEKHDIRNITITRLINDKRLETKINVRNSS